MPKEEDKLKALDETIRLYMAAQLMQVGYNSDDPSVTMTGDEGRRHIASLVARICQLGAEITADAHTRSRLN